MSGNQSYNFFRYFSVASLIGIFLTAIALTELNRRTAIETIVKLGEDRNSMIAKTALNAIRPNLINYLENASTGEENSSIGIAAFKLLQDSVQATMHGTSVVRIKIYSPDGLVAYSTKMAQIGSDGRKNRGFISAMDGDITSKLVYRGTFNLFDSESESDNLIQT